MMKTTTLAIAAAIAAGTLAHAQDADCNVNGIPDAAEIAAGLVDDCNANGIPDPCEYAKVAFEAETSPFGSGSPLVVPIDQAPHAISDMRISLAVRADLDSVTEIVQAYLGSTVVATLWITGGEACPAEPQVQTVIVPMATANASIDANGGDLIVAVQASGAVGAKECPNSVVVIGVEYIGDLLPADCLGNGTWDGCDIAADPGLDCDVDGLIDLCEIEDDPGLDCDGNGVLDTCELDCDGNGVNDLCDIAAIPALDCDGNGQIDSCELIADPTLDCDVNGIVDSCDITASPSLDCDGNGQIDTCEFSADPTLDCDGNGVLDACQIAAAGPDCTFDCDGDGMLDACQLGSNPSLDKNDNGVLDSCEYDRGDFTLDGSVDGADLAFQLALWGLKNPSVGDLNADGIIDGADLAQLLGNWGEVAAFICPTIDVVTPRVGPPSGGMPITITGQQLASVIAVTIGGVPATNVVAVNSKTITALTPSSKTQGARDVVVTTTAGAATLAGGYVYSVVAEWATVLDFEPDPGVITSGEWYERIIATGLPWRVQDNASGIEMLLIPAGQFMMGCSASQLCGCSNWENPVHEVTLTQTFYLGRHEVTQSQWTAVMGSNPSEFQSASAQVPVEQVLSRPVESVNWDGIQTFENATGLRLPTEAEWEYACRGGTQTAFNLTPNGTNVDSQLGHLAWFESNSAEQTRPVGQKQANNLGLYDMHGNVREWVEDWFSASYYYGSPNVDPPGPSETVFRACRGGGWVHPFCDCRASKRNFGNHYFGDMYTGFRVARTP